MCISKQLVDCRRRFLIKGAREFVIVEDYQKEKLTSFENGFGKFQNIGIFPISVACKPFLKLQWSYDFSVWKKLQYVY